MQKKLIALAIAGLSSTAFAQSNVTISGQLKGGYERYSVKSTGATDGSQNLFSDQTSNIVLKGEENLGNGLSAIFQIDNRFTLDTGNTSTATALSTTAGAGTTGTLGSGNTWVGIKSASFGEVKLGRNDIHYNESERIENGAKSLSQQALASRALLSQVGGSALTIGPAATRTNNLVFWDSPNWSGITARLAYSANPYGQEGPSNSAAGTGDKGKAYNGVVRYENGPIKTGLSYYKQTAEDGLAGATSGADADQKSTRIWGAYNIAGFSLGLIYDRSKGESTTTETKRNAWAIPLSYTMGNHGFYLTYAKAGDSKTNGTSTANSGAKQVALGYDYSLSKRTSVGVNYAKLTNESAGVYNFANITAKGTALTAGDDAKQIYVGIRHAY